VEDFIVSASIEAVKPGDRSMNPAETSSLHPTIVALVALSANIAANHPNQGLCQIERLKGYGVSQAHIDTVIEIARHLRDEAAQKLDAQFDQAYAEAMLPAKPKTDPLANLSIQTHGGACCTPTQSGQSCC
jgi:hypothetical protein